jgi:23S rRNA (pseudouridine1915-N3)-methyltransferase
MKIRFIVIGKTEETYLKKGMAEYESRINRYVKFSITEIPGLKNASHLSKEEWKAKEAEKISQHLSSTDYIILLDEKGKEMTSVEFSGFLNQKFSGSGKSLTFIVGGPFGFDESLKKQAGQLLSLSRMTFSHQMVRLFFMEQLYRAMTILKNESYHHDG